MLIANTDYLFAMKCLPILQSIPPEELYHCAHRIVIVRYAQGTEITCGTGDCVGLLILKSGTLRIYLLSDEGREITLYQLHEEDVCVLSTTPAMKYTTLAIKIEAETDCEALLIDTSSFDMLCKNNLCVENYVNRLLHERFSSAMSTLARSMSTSLDQRVAFFLANEISEVERNDIPLTHDKVARHIGSTREVVTRSLNGFSENGIVKLTRGNIEVLNMGKLDELNS